MCMEDKLVILKAYSIFLNVMTKVFDKDQTQHKQSLAMKVSISKLVAGICFGFVLG